LETCKTFIPHERIGGMIGEVEEPIDGSCIPFEREMGRALISVDKEGRRSAIRE